MNRLAQRFLDTPPAKWDGIVNKYRANPADMQVLYEAIVALEQFAMHTARLALYLRSRYTTALHGDQDAAHARAVALQNKETARVRKALGYTYTENIRF